MNDFACSATILTLPRSEVPISMDPLSGLVTVYGSPGSGKTVLLRYLARQVREGGNQVSILSAKHDVVDEYSDVADSERIAGSQFPEEVNRVLQNVKPSEYLLIDLSDYYFENNPALLKKVVNLRKQGANLVLASNVTGNDVSDMVQPQSVVFLEGRVSRHTLVQGAPWLKKVSVGIEIGLGRAMVTTPETASMIEVRVPFIPHPHHRNLTLPAPNTRST